MVVWNGILKYKSYMEETMEALNTLALAWHMAKGVAFPIIGATKTSYFDDAAGAFDLAILWYRETLNV